MHVNVIRISRIKIMRGHPLEIAVENSSKTSSSSSSFNIQHTREKNQQTPLNILQKKTAKKSPLEFETLALAHYCSSSGNEEWKIWIRSATPNIATHSKSKGQSGEMLINFNRDAMKYLKINMQMNELIVPTHRRLKYSRVLWAVWAHIFMHRWTTLRHISS